MEITTKKEVDVLIVEDEKLLRWSLSEELRKCGYRVDSDATGEDAIRRTRLKRYDVVITDLKLGGIDGLDVAAVLRIAAPNTKVILITAFGTPEVEARAKACGVFRYLNKPIEGQLVAGVVKEAMTAGEPESPEETSWETG